jgi:hypothetical protein
VAALSTRTRPQSGIHAKEYEEMSDTKTHGGFAGDPADALTVSGTSSCCGNPAQATLTLPDPDAAHAHAADSAAASAMEPAIAPCCGTSAEAAATGSCCGTAAKAEAVAAGTGCCG